MNTQGVDDSHITRLELRVHGIGSHDYFDALGSPSEKVIGQGHEPDIVGPPTIPRHNLRLLNWSRTSRGLARYLWYLALPFTLVNVAGYMGPQKSGWGISCVRFVLGVATVLTGLLLTVSLQLWSIAIAETALRQLAVSNYQCVGQIIVWGITLALTGGIIVRTRFLRHHSPAFYPWQLRLAAWLSVLALISVGILISLSPPAQWSASDPPRLLSVFVVQTPIDKAAVDGLYDDLHAHPPKIADCRAPGFDWAFYRFVPRWDVLNIVTLGSMAAVAFFATMLLLAAVILAAVGGNKTDQSSLAGAALILVCAITLLPAFAGSLMLGVEWLMKYLYYVVPWDFLRGRETNPSERFILAYQNYTCEFGPRLVYDFSVLAALGGVLLLVSLILANCFGEGGAGNPMHCLRSQLERMKYVHRMIASLGKRLLWALPLAGLTWFMLSYWIMIAVTVGTSFWALALTSSIIVLSHALGFFAVAFIIAYKRLKTLSSFLAMIADIAGFWPVAWHPLAGRTYRHYVINGIETELDRWGLERVALVGHSQGSVLCAWLMAHRDNGGPEIHLVTCGSPLHSLYETFFPNEINQSVLSRITTSGKNSWANFWRETDPIATELTATAQNECLPDPLDVAKDPQPQGHSDYWTDPTLIKYVDKCLVSSK